MNNFFASKLKSKICSTSISPGRRSIIQLFGVTLLQRIERNSSAAMSMEAEVFVVKNGWVVKKKEIRS